MIFSFTQSDISDCYRYLHTIPEPEFCEFKTSDYIYGFLKKLGLSPVKCAKTGIYADICGKEPGKTILLRADIDALPLNEESGVPFCSAHKGYMHACGHDYHMACLLFAAKALAENKNSLKGKVRVLFQPAEEGSGGALPMINEGAADGADMAFAMHTEPLEATGTILYKNGGITASPDDYKVIITGKSGHGAEPEKCINPITIASEIIRRYNKIKETYFKDVQCVTTVCTINSGTLNNIIPETAVITGTARSFDAEIREKLKNILASCARKTATEYGGKCDFIYNALYPPTVNSEAANDILIKAALKTEGITSVKELEKGSMTGDDFSYFAQKVPSSYFKIGVGGKGERYPLHSSKFKIDEKALIIGTKLFVNICLQYMANQN